MICIGCGGKHTWLLENCLVWRWLENPHQGGSNVLLIVRSKILSTNDDSQSYLLNYYLKLEHRTYYNDLVNVPVYANYEFLGQL